VKRENRCTGVGSHCEEGESLYGCRESRCTGVVVKRENCCTGVGSHCNMPSQMRVVVTDILDGQHWKITTGTCVDAGCQ
jgi:hypothetical protein